MNVLIKGACTVCDHDVQFLPEEDSDTKYTATCSVCGTEYKATVGVAAPKPAAAEAEVKPAAEPKATSTRSTREASA